jgi:uncharacterized membrane protein YccC
MSLLHSLHSLHRLPAYAVNGIAVALGIAAIQLLIGALAGAHPAQLALSGAVCVSLADVPNTAARTWRRVSAAMLLSTLAVATVALLKGHPWALGAGIMVIAFVAMMTMAWGARAGAVSFAPILALVFTMAVPESGRGLLTLLGWNAVGAAAYLLWSLASAALLQRRYRTLALAATLRAAAQLLRSRAALLESPAPRQALAQADALAMQAWLQGEAELADKLQTARDFVFAAPDTARVRRDTALLLRAIDLRDVLLASRLDLDLLGSDEAGRWILQRVGQALRRFGAALDDVAVALRDGSAPPALPGADHLHGLFDDAPMPLPEARQRLLPAVGDRLRNIGDDVLRMHALLKGAAESAPRPANTSSAAGRGGSMTQPLTREELQRFVAPEGWPLRALLAQASIESPVLRHALRAALALGSAYFIALALPWASHPHWLVLSVAVVLRGNLEQTLSRRNARVGGTMLGCAAVLALSHGAAPLALQLVFLAAVGTAHAFVLQRYWLTATAATVMALLQAHMVAPAGGFAIGERVADTVLGAALAWAFSYVLPSWERRHLPRLIAAALLALREFAQHALRGPTVDAVEQRLARRRAYDALGALAAALQRSSAEPSAVQLPVRDVAALIDHGQRLMAHLSMVRLTLARRSAELSGTAAATALQQAAQTLGTCLDLKSAAPPHTPNDEADAGLLQELPAEAPADNILPWLERRLQWLAHDGRRIHAAARRALAPAQAAAG